jgi:hypothetical protein
VPFDLNRVSPLVIAGLDPAIHAEKTLRRPCRNGFDCGKSAWTREVKSAHDERDCSDPNGTRSSGLLKNLW